eukprot:TRINITY_DN2774_c0_g1_i1.p1 TRINITY_DN2774_c0_g1~~TRINITY_DN2774_c0_g1_i1.p1  ORF type:complete len:201 (+),score=46.75 TRINITY_DN2774_c0_g1_i1:48-605(+)
MCIRDRGKSCLMMRFSDGKFPIDIIGTAGIDCKEKVLGVEGKNIRVQIWDTAGQERYSTLTESYYKKAFGILLAYDITDLDSFKSVDNWIKSIKDKGNAIMEVVLVGNKTDLKDDRKVSTTMGQKLAQSYKIPFIETSAMDGSGVIEAFKMLIENILRNEGLVGQCKTEGTKISVSKNQGKSTCP